MTFNELVEDNRIWFGEEGTSRPRKKVFLSEVDGTNAWTWWQNEDVGHNQEASKELKDLLGIADLFRNPKPSRLIKQILKIATNPNDIILDFFAGSGTTGHAIMDINLSEQSSRKVIMVQIPEITEENGSARKAGFKTISEITIARNKAVTEKIRKSFEGKLITTEDQQQLNQLGFKVFTLSKSSFPRVDFAPDPTKNEEENLGLFNQYIAEKEQQLNLTFNNEELITEILITRGFRSMESNCSMTIKIPPNGVSFSDFICTFAMSCTDFRLIFNRSTKLSEKSDMAKS